MRRKQGGGPIVAPACPPRTSRTRSRRDARGASSIEYGLMIALIAAVLCVGLGVTLKTVFGDALSCFVAGLQGSASSNPTCSVGPPGGGGGGGGSSGGGGSGGVPTTTPSSGPSPTPTATATPSPTS